MTLPTLTVPPVRLNAPPAEIVVAIETVRVPALTLKLLAVTAFVRNVVVPEPLSVTLESVPPSNDGVPVEVTAIPPEPEAVTVPPFVKCATEPLRVRTFAPRATVPAFVKTPATDSVPLTVVVAPVTLVSMPRIVPPARVSVPAEAEFVTSRITAVAPVPPVAAVRLPRVNAPAAPLRAVAVAFQPAVACEFTKVIGWLNAMDPVD